MSSDNHENTAPPALDNASEPDVPVTQKELVAAVDSLKGDEVENKESDKIESNASTGDEETKKESDNSGTNAAQGRKPLKIIENEFMNADGKKVISEEIIYDDGSSTKSVTVDGVLETPPTKHVASVPSAGDEETKEKKKSDDVESIASLASEITSGPDVPATQKKLVTAVNLLKRDADARKEFATTISQTMVEGCSTAGSYQRVLFLNLNVLILEAQEAVKDGDPQTTDETKNVAKTICELLLKAASGNTYDQLLSKAEALLKKILGNKSLLISVVASSFLENARLPPQKVTDGLYIPSTILALKINALTPESQDENKKWNSEGEDHVVAFRRDVMDLFGRRMFCLGSQMKPASSEQVTLATSLITEITRDEFNGSILRPLKFKIMSAPDTSMETLGALTRTLTKAGNGDFLKTHLKGGTNIVRVVVTQLQNLKNEKARADALTLIVALLEACPDNATTDLTKALSEALKDATENESESICEGLDTIAEELLKMKEGSVTFQNWEVVANDDAIPSLKGEKCDAGYSALAKWYKIAGKEPEELDKKIVAEERLSVNVGETHEKDMPFVVDISEKNIPHVERETGDKAGVFDKDNDDLEKGERLAEAKLVTDDEYEKMQSAEVYEKPKFHQTKKFKIYSILCILICVGIAVGVAVGVSMSAAGKDVAIEIGEEVTSTPSLAPSTSFKTELRSFLKESSVSDNPPFDDQSTAYGKAFNWMIDDRISFDYYNDVQTKKLADRYYLSLLYYSLTENNAVWSECAAYVDGMNFTGNDDEINCKKTLLNPQTGSAEQRPSSRWLSSKHVCDDGNINWGGILCVDDDEIAEINLVEDNLNGFIPPEIGFLTRLNVWFMFGTGTDRGNIAGTLPSEVGNLQELQTINIGGQILSGEIPNEFYGIKSLQVVNINFNNFEGTISTELGLLTKLKGLFASDNQLSGSIPKSIGQLTELENLQLSRNQKLNGTLPTEIGKLSSLEELWLQNCTGLEGSLPYEIGGLTSLRLLFLQANKFSKNLPSTFYDLTRLEVAYLRRNSFTGTIGNEISNLTKLTQFLVDGNQFNGTIPSPIGNLYAAYFHSNNFEGKFPCTTQYIDTSKIFSADCTSPAAVQCECCILCCKEGTCINELNNRK